MRVFQEMANWEDSLNPDFDGTLNGDHILVGIGAEYGSTDYRNFLVVQRGVSGQTLSIEKETESYTELRAGTSTEVVSASRKIVPDGKCVEGDEFQKLVRDPSMAFALGSDGYRYACIINLRTGMVEYLQVSVNTTNDGSGNASEKATFSTELNQVGGNPKWCFYNKTSGFPENQEWLDMNTRVPVSEKDVLPPEYTVDPPVAEPDPESEEEITWGESNGVWNESTSTWQDPSLGQPVATE